MTSWMSDDSDLRHHLINSAQYMRLIIMGMVMKTSQQSDERFHVLNRHRS